MNGKFKTIQWVIIVILALVTVFGIFAVHHQGEQINDLKDKKANVKIPKKQSVVERTSQDDVKEYQGKVEDKIDRYLRKDLDEGVFNYDNSGVNTIRTLFSPAGVSPVTEKQSHKAYVKHYDKFDYKLKNAFIDKNYDGSADVYCQIESKYKGHKINENYDLFMLHLDENGKLTGGKLYAKQS